MKECESKISKNAALHHCLPLASALAKFKPSKKLSKKLANVHHHRNCQKKTKKKLAARPILIDTN
jgi:hypothetical protein